MFQVAINSTRQAVTAAAEEVHTLAKLSKNPEELWLLWKEYEYGIDGEKMQRIT